MKRFCILIPLLIATAACGGGDDSSSRTGSSGAGITISGSSTVEPISAAVAESYRAENNVPIQVDGPGTGDGFQLFCDGETDIADASREIAEEEIAACEQAGVEYVELKIAFDGISVLTSPQNEVECVTFDDLYELVGPEATGVSNWQEANPDFPDLDLVVTGPGEESGTYDSFVEIVIEDRAEENGEEPQTRPDYQSSPNDNVIIEGVAGTTGSLGWVGFAFAENASDSVKQLEVDGGDGCVAPTTETIAEGSYPISRPLFIYVNTAHAAENDDLAALVDFYLSDEGIAAVEQVGYVPLPDDQLAETRAAWTGR